jgi:hypothetical protein
VLRDFVEIDMFFGRLISLVLSTALVACPAVCKAGHCAACPQEETKTNGCPHCQAEQSAASTDTQPSRPRLPVDSHDACDFGNCLCAGALTNHAGLDLQLGHVLGLFEAAGVVDELPIAVLSSPDKAAVTFDQHGPPSSGRSLRLRIGSLLI